MDKSNYETASFAAGCFWGVEESFRSLPGVISTRVGYTGGHRKNPTHQEVCTGMTGHAEAVEVQFDPEIINYRNLLNVFWSIHDATRPRRQGHDHGSQYRSALFYHSAEQRNLAHEVKDELEEATPHPILTEIVPAHVFYEAEEYHQKYYQKHNLVSCHA